MSPQQSNGQTGPWEGLAARVRTRLRRSTLDEHLARGDDPETSLALSLRAAQLSAERRRQLLHRDSAEELRGALRAARAALDAAEPVHLATAA